MSMFGKKEPEQRATPQVVRSRFQTILDDLDTAYKHMDHASHLFSTLINDVEKGMRFIDRFRVDLTQAIGETGGTVESDPTKIEDEIRKYVRPEMQKVQE